MISLPKSIFTRPKRFLHALALMVLPLLMASCLPAPVGDASTAKVDKALLGAWLGKMPRDDADSLVLLLNAWDERTYLVRCFVTSNANEPVEIGIAKAWLHNVGDQRFLSFERDIGIEGVEVIPSPLRWSTFQIALENDSLTLRCVDPKFDGFIGAKTQADVERVVAREVGNKGLYYPSPLVLKRLGKQDAVMVGSTMQKHRYYNGHMEPFAY